jgi:hypothetical protein
MQWIIYSTTVPAWAEVEYVNSKRKRKLISTNTPSRERDGKPEGRHLISIQKVPLKVNSVILMLFPF